eukprot:TRINITY_DN16529_c0_g1_i3.p1 TRINITY_DN16529_c0_g1~~TRINITY_DN16529_c0_g1_i3.p1  ORF type:complete len:166 (-),score=18.64 TRINITY_DN16529_c0_g1_i3:294-791(-)
MRSLGVCFALASFLNETAAYVHTGLRGADWRTSPKAEGAALQARLDLPQPLRNDDGSQERRNASSLFTGILLGLCVAVTGWTSSPKSALASGDVGNGETVFASNCVSCHAAGTNKIYPTQDLKKAALQKNGKYSEAGDEWPAAYACVWREAHGAGDRGRGCLCQG